MGGQGVALILTEVSGSEAIQTYPEEAQSEVASEFFNLLLIAARSEGYVYLHHRLTHVSPSRLYRRFAVDTNA